MGNTSIKKVFERGNGEKYPVTFELKDGTLMVNATQMGKAFGELKKPVYFLRSKGTRAFINELKKEFDGYGENSHRSYVKVPYITVTDGRPSLRGTWMHEKLALKYAAWIAPSFEKWVYDNITELIKTGSVELDQGMMQQMQMHLDPQTQRNNTKEVTRKIYLETDGDVKQIPLYHHKSLVNITGLRKKDWVDIGKSKGLPKTTINKGAKEIIRVLEPKFTCVMSLADNMLASTKTLKVEDQSMIADIAKDGLKMFDRMLKMGVRPQEIRQK
jgi:hypothetical protein